MAARGAGCGLADPPIRFGPSWEHHRLAPARPTAGPAVLTHLDARATMVSMVMPMSTEDRVRQLHERAVRELVEAHKQRTDEPLVLAIQFDLADTQDIHLLEVLEGFPGGDDDELLVTEFEPSAQLRILGKLQLALGSPAQLASVIRRGGEQLERFRHGAVVHDDGSKRAAELKRGLGL